MALVKSGTTGVGSPLLQYELYAEQTAASVNNRTIKITLKAKPNGNGFYGYPVNWRANINGTWSGWMAMKGAETWKGADGFKTFTYTATTNVGTTSSKAITVGFGSDSYGGDNDWDSTVTGSFTVGFTNRAPGAPSSIIVRNGGNSNSPLLSSGIVPENVSSVYVSWNAAVDPDGDTLKYALNQSLNDGGYTQVDLGNDLDHAYTPSNWGEGASIKFYVDAQDSKGAWSPKTYSGSYTKNRLSAGGFSGHSNDVSFETQYFDLMFGGGSNTDKSSVTYSCYSDTLTIYNQTYVGGSSQRILIWREGDSTPSSNQPYIRFTDIINHYKNSSYTGRLHVGLRTKNNYGTVKTSSGSIGVNVQIAPEPPQEVVITGGAVKKNIAGLDVYVPNGVDEIDFSWTSSTNKLGAPFTYDLYQLFNGVEIKITSVASTVNNFSIVLEEQIGETTNLSFKVVAITNYGFSASTVSSSVVLEYYNPPTISIGEIYRTDSTASFDVSVNTNTSIASVVGGCDWQASNSTTGTIESEGRVELVDLQSQSSYSVTLKYGDNSGLSDIKQETVGIGRNLPIVDISENGLGVGGVVANSTYSLNVEGSSNSTEVYENGIRVYSPNSKPTPKDIGAIAATSSSTGYYGMEGPGGSAGWLRTPSTGIIPYENGLGRLGTSSWRFEDVCTSKINGLTVGVSSSLGNNAIPTVANDGVMEVGQIIDFNLPGSGKDYDARIQAFSNGNIAINKYIRVDGRTFKGWAFSSSDTYWCGLSATDEYLRMYTDTGSVANNVTNLGSASGRFKKLYCTSATDISSDIRLKRSIMPVEGCVERLYGKLKPCSWISVSGDSGRRHYGFIAQEVESAMKAAHIGYEDFAFLQKAPLDKNGEEIDPSTIRDYERDERIYDYSYSLAYTEMIAVNTHMIQKLQKENEELRKEIEDIKSSLSGGQDNTSYYPTRMGRRR